MAGYTYLFFSVFYAKHSWSFLSKAVVDFTQNQRTPLPYILYLNHDRGDNVRFIFKVPTKRAEKALLDIDRFFNQFLLAHPSASPEPVVFPPPGLYLNFPNNSVRYSLFDFSVLKKNLRSAAIHLVFEHLEQISAILTSCELADEVARLRLWFKYINEVLHTTTPSITEAIEFLQQHCTIDSHNQDQVLEDALASLAPFFRQTLREIWCREPGEIDGTLYAKPILATTVHLRATRSLDNSFFDLWTIILQEVYSMLCIKNGGFRFQLILRSLGDFSAVR